MNINEQLAIFVDQLNHLEEPSNPTGVDNLIAFIGCYPSIETLEEVVKYYKEKKNTIERVDIPCALAEAGLQDATMKDGTYVSIDTIYETKQGDKSKLAAWLEENGYGDIIKDTFAFEKGGVDEDLLQFLQDRAYNYARDSSIHSMTLKKVLKDHLNAGGTEPPEDAVKISIFRKADVKKPKGGF